MARHCRGSTPWTNPYQPGKVWVMRVDYVLAHPEVALTPYQQNVLRAADPDVQCPPATIKVLYRMGLIDADFCLTSRGEDVLRALENV